jgi:hypothetical protein
MSFDVILHHFRDGKDSEPADRQAVLAAIRSYSDVTVDKYGQYDVPLRNGEHIILAASDLESDAVFKGCAFNLRGFSIQHCEFILDIARAGDMVMFNAQGNDTPQNPVLILCATEQELHVPKGMYKNAIVAENGLHLYSLLEGTFESWNAYRAQVVNPASNSAS